MKHKWIILLAIPLLIAVNIGQSISFYYHQNYLADIALNYVQRAQATNDLQDNAYWLNQSLIQLSSYQGNPAWPFPTPETSYDLIKNNIQVDIQNCLKWSNANYSEIGYQQAVYNLQQSDASIASQLAAANIANWYSPYINPIGYMLTILDLPIVVLALFFYSKIKDEKQRN